MADWFDTARDNALVICPTERMARELRRAFNARMRAQGQTTWAYPPIVAFRNWAIDQWQSRLPDEQLLYPAQELALHLYGVESDEQSQGLLSAMSFARQVRATDRLVLNYGVTLPAADFLDRDEYRCFKQLRQRFEGTARANGWITAERVVDRLIEAIRAGAHVPPRHVLFHGFAELTGQQGALIEVLRNAGTRVSAELIAPPAASGVVSRHRFKDAGLEVRGMAHAVQSILAHADNQSQPSIGVFVPAIDAWRPALDDALWRELAPGQMIPGSDRLSLPWVYARGEILTRLPAIAIALDLFSLARSGNDIDTLSRLLLSRSLWGGRDRALRARIEYKLRALGGARHGLDYVCTLAQKLGPQTFFTARLVGLFKAIEEQGASALPSAWSDHLEARLQCAGWVLFEQGSSFQYQVLEAWRGVRAQFAAMDRQLGAIRRIRAHAWLREILANRDFNPQTEIEAPVRILEYADAAGASFDHVFVLGLTADALPGAQAHNPFLDAEYLDAAGVPTFTAASMLERGRELLHWLFCAGDTVTLSHAVYGERSNLQLPSLIAGPWPDSIEAETPRKAVDGRVPSLSTYLPTSDPVPPVADFERDYIRRGVSTLGLQASVPYVAVARSRLGVEPMPLAGSGLDARVQGTYVHAVLDKIWGRVRNRDGLRARSAGQLRTLIAEAARTAAVDDDLLPERVYGPALCHLERARVEQLCEHWLGMEAQRELDFEVVVREKRLAAMIGDLPVRLQLDRVDRVDTEQGDAYIAIDYKTSAYLSTKGWHPDTLTDPQLPIYASSDALQTLGIPRVDGIAFGQLAATGCHFTLWSWIAGRLVADSRGRTGKPVGHWDALLDAWRTALDTHAAAFMNGQAAIEPASLVGFNRFDDLLPLMKEREVYNHD